MTLCLRDVNETSDEPQIVALHHGNHFIEILLVVSIQSQTIALLRFGWSPDMCDVRVGWAHNWRAAKDLILVEE